VSITLRIPLFQAKEMTLPQQNIASARPTSFYYLMCQLDRVQYRIDYFTHSFISGKRNDLTAAEYRFGKAN
ncbi:MAG: hypothetical protein LKJ72_01120, partial [[Lactobacillus] timonensis]|nr:hypothetical protein [[Lactobacillus] timonensis]MCI1969957.1 hypothetical protein [[Lactobacillus] timonensis]MCI2006158.1 hypothetical protein [[Lactobacillus] timonensis]